MGRWCFTHEAGIHVQGVLANPETYQPYPPKLVGRTHEIAVGKHSGANTVTFLAERAGVSLGDSARKAVLDKIKTQAERKQGMVTVEDVLAWIRAEAG